MRKLRLDVEQLTVETFEVTRAAERERGTVRGHLTNNVITCDNTDCNQNTCLDTCATCPNTCWYSCGDTCPGTCPNTCAQSCNGTCYDPSCVNCNDTWNDPTCEASCDGTCPPQCTNYKYLC